MANSMQHWNNNQMVVCTLRTTGPDPDWHELIQLCFIALDSNCVLRRDVLPLTFNIRCDYPERREKPHCSEKLLLESQKHMPLLPSKAEEVFLNWVDKLELRHSKYRNRKKLLLLGYDTWKVIPWLRGWLTLEFEDQFEIDQIRDIKSAALYLNDYQGMHVEDIKFVKHTLNYLANKSELPRPKKKDTLNEAILISKIYNYMIRRGNG